MNNSIVMRSDRYVTVKYGFLAILCALAMSSCSRALTQEDIRDNLKEAREATVEAQEKAQMAFESRQQFYTDYKLTQVAQLEDRIKQINDRINDLQKTAKKSSNSAAVGDMKSAIKELKNEKKGVQRRISEVQALEERDWTQSNEAINAAIAEIQTELDKLSQSLEGYAENEK